MTLQIVKNDKTAKDITSGKERLLLYLTILDTFTSDMVVRILLLDVSNEYVYL